jgi:AbrB family looped-hinge helix DNA binding protein
MSSRVDEKGRILVPKSVAEEMGLSKGDIIIFERTGDFFIIKKLEMPHERLEEAMSWNPERVEKPEPVSPAEMKGIWKTSRV